MNWILSALFVLPFLLPQTSMACADQVSHQPSSQTSANANALISTNQMRIGKLWKQVLSVAPEATEKITATLQSPANAQTPVG
jgi:hypothetical protein